MCKLQSFYGGEGIVNQLFLHFVTKEKKEREKEKREGDKGFAV